MAPRPDAPPRYSRALAPLLTLSIVLVACPGEALAQGLAMGTTACTKVDLSADTMDCKADHCHLSGDVRLDCETMKLFSETLDLDLKDGQFAGGVARGDVMVADGNRLITCDSFTIGPDRIQTSLKDAVVQVKRTNAVDPTSGLPTGRDQAVYKGSRMDRPSAKQLIIDDGTFTLCDCGKDKKPSWHLSSPHIDAELDNRATIMWPMFWITPFGIPIDMPLTPPLLPMSVPLKSRAMGFLAPRIGFLGKYPSLDLPFFIPLGDSWDLTIGPGIRTDWSPSHTLSPSTWGAGRVSGRLRYAPVADTVGDWSFDWTHDPMHGAVYVIAVAGDKSQSLDKREKALPQYYLKERVALNGYHRSDFNKDLTLLFKGTWVSDDLYPADFRQANPPYLPSRAQVQWRTGGFEARVGADYIERLGNYNGSAGFANGLPPGLKNWDPIELAGAQHGPYLRATLVPLSLAGGLSVSGDASFDRYGGWSTASDAAPTAVLLRAAPGLMFAHALGPVALSAQGSFDAAWLTHGSGLESPTRSLAVVANAQASTTLARRFGTVLHAVVPRLEYRALPWRDGPALETGAGYQTSQLSGTQPVPFSFLDERLRRDQTVEQAAIGVWQELSTGAGTALNRVATLDISQPYDLSNRELLPMRAAASVGHPAWGSFAAEASVYLPGIGRPGQDLVGQSRDRALRELTVGVGSPPTWPVTLSVDYRRYTPETSRFLRSIYQLEAPLITPQSSTWRSYVTPSVALILRPTLTLRYTAPYDLAVPGATTTGIAQHIFEVLYHSPCDCWDLRLVGVKYRDSAVPLSFGFTISIANFAIGGAK
jgi:hypothetical protein